jgi:hypothetical protein
MGLRGGLVAGLGAGAGRKQELGRAEEAKAQGVRGASADLGLMGHKHMWAEKDERKRLKEKGVLLFSEFISGKE